MKWKIWVIVLVWIWVAVLAIPDQKLRIIVCDVGQGDAILFQRGTQQLLVDGGGNERVLDCLGKYMPFYDRQIEIVLLTHPEADHLGGLIDVVKRYRLIHFIEPVVGKDTKIYNQLKKEIGIRKINSQKVYAGDKLKMANMEIKIVWPERDWVEKQTDFKEVNSFSTGAIVEYGKFKIMLTGDADVEIEPSEISYGRIRAVDVLKVPHHGSKTGMTQEWLQVLSPKLAVISVGKNSYGHPTAEALNLLSSFGAKILRTDQAGDIVIVCDGKSWEVK